MRKIIFISLLMMFFCKISAQNIINIVISIDDRVTASYNISNVFLKMENDKIPMEYESGRFIIDKLDYDRFNNYNSQKDIILQFDYHQFCPHNKVFSYSINLKAGLFKQRYFNINIYNFENYPNLFRNNFDYGYEYVSPVISETLPKKRRKHVIPHCRG